MIELETFFINKRQLNVGFDGRQCLFLHEREYKNEFGTLVFGAAGGNEPVVLVHDLFGNRQPDARAFVGVQVVEPLENDKNPVEKFLVEADPAIVMRQYGPSGDTVPEISLLSTDS